MMMRFPSLLFALIISISCSFPTSTSARTSPATANAPLVKPGFTMIIATHNRDSLLGPLLAHLTVTPPPSLTHILIIWQNVNRPLPSYLFPAALAINSPLIPVTVRVSHVNSMNERFRPILDWNEAIETDDVMIMDDDIVLRKSVLEWGYGVFLEHNTLLRRGNPRGGRIVGFTGRDFIRGPKGASWKWDYNFQPRETYSLVLSNAAWFKKEWLEIYWSDRKEMTDLRDFVDDVFNCDDLLVNFIISNHTLSPPLLLQPTVPLRTVQTDGLWNRPGTEDDTTDLPLSTPEVERPSAIVDDLPRLKKLGHFAMRAECLSIYFDYFAKWDPDRVTLASGGKVEEEEVSHYPLIRTAASISQDISDHARFIAENEEWEAPIWTVYSPPSPPVSDGTAIEYDDGYDDDDFDEEGNFIGELLPGDELAPREGDDIVKAYDPTKIKDEL